MAEMQPIWLTALCYSAEELRRLTGATVCSEGVSDVPGGALLVTTGGVGLDLSIAQGSAFVDSDVADGGMYQIYNDGPTTVTATTADPTNPRIDQVIATVQDSDQGDGADDWILTVLPGTPTVGATLANRTGAAALPDRSIRLAYVLVPATFTGPFVDATHILDARTPWASCAGATAPLVVFNASGHFFKDAYPGLKAVRVRAKGGGGAGAGANTTSTTVAVGGGGGEGGEGESIILVDDLATDETVTVGAGGTAPVGSDGNSGGTSSFGSLVTGLGGVGGSVLVSGSTAQAIAGGSGSGGTGDIVHRGAPGQPGIRFSAGSGSSGSGGGGGRLGRVAASSSSQAGLDATSSSGGGGGGALNVGTQTPVTGGLGGSGYVVVELIY